jgi:predicted RNA-binding protein
MCEFTVKKKIGKKTEVVGEDVIFFQYTDSGQARLADILGRSKISIPNGIVCEINMLENRHDITLLESSLVPFFIRYLQALQSNDELQKKTTAEELMAEMRKELP